MPPEKPCLSSLTETRPISPKLSGLASPLTTEGSMREVLMTALLVLRGAQLTKKGKRKRIIP
jgi:hypothetical protein